MTTILHNCAKPDYPDNQPIGHLASVSQRVRKHIEEAFGWAKMTRQDEVAWDEARRLPLHLCDGRLQSHPDAAIIGRDIGETIMSEKKSAVIGK
jgi:hypothetical protein